MSVMSRLIWNPTDVQIFTGEGEGGERKQSCASGKDARESWCL